MTFNNSTSRSYGVGNQLKAVSSQLMPTLQNNHIVQVMAIEEDTRKPPLWLNVEYVTKALQKGMNEPFLQVKTMDIKPATAVGDNYASLMFRAVLTIQKTTKEERLSVVIKTLPKAAEKMDSLMRSVFEREAQMFLTVLPEINKRLKDVYPDHQPLNANCFWFSKDPEPVIILEDLKELGFGLADRMAGLDVTTTNMVLDRLAKYHAASYAVAQDMPEKIKGVDDNLWAENDDIAVMSQLGLEGLIEEASDWKDFPKEYVQKLKDLKPVIAEKMRDALQMDEKNLNILSHGDCWINNMMISPEKGAIKALRFVDFQMCGINSAGVDLNYFMFTSPSANICLKTDEMLKTYYSSFMETINKLGIKLNRSFTFNDLKTDFQKRVFFGFIALIIIYPITVTEKADVKNINDFMDETTSKRQTYRSPIFQNRFKLTLPYFIDCGVL